jgi:hypothetical protein
LTTSRYACPEVGAWVKPVRYPPKSYKFACCDCGLVHRFRFRIVPNKYGRGKVIQFQAERDRRATGQMRRWMKKKTAAPIAMKKNATPNERARPRGAAGG